MQIIFSAYAIEAIEAVRDILKIIVKRRIPVSHVIVELDDYINEFYKGPEGKKIEPINVNGKMWYKVGNCPLCGAFVYQRFF